MEERINTDKIGPDGRQAMRSLQAYVNGSGLEPSLQELIKIRASQINGCANCLAMHVRDARKLGETDDRMHLLSAWHEAPCFSARERAALAWTEAVTLVTQGHVSDEVYEEACHHFSERELVDLTYAIIAINGWNRLAIAFRKIPQMGTSSG